MCRLPGLEEAQKWYFKALLEDAWGFYECNGSAPKGCPEPLRKYFRDDSLPGRDSSDLVSEGRAASQREGEGAQRERGPWKK